MEMNCMQRRTWAEIDLNALEYNYRVLRSHIPQSAKICCVIKANAYGHGLTRVAKLYDEIGADFLAVANIEEAIAVRNAGVRLPLLILGYTPPECAMLLAQNRISQCVYSYEYAKALAKEAMANGVVISIHLKIDVGMGRLGFIFREGEETGFKEAVEICRLPCFRTEGVFAHFPVADDVALGREATQKQFDNFNKAIDKLEAEGIRFYIKHCSNSAAATNYPQFSLDMVRLGIALYGVLPSNAELPYLLRTTLTLKTVISSLKVLKKGEAIGYGSEFVAQKDITVATLPIGYGDGFRRENFHNGTKLYVNGVLCPITGRVCMDQTMIDVSELKNLNIGDEVIVYGKGSPIKIEEFSKTNGTISYETMCEISSRVSRVYIKEDNREL